MRLSVPNNAMDIVARAWCRGNDSETGDADPRTHRTMKTVRPYWLHGARVRYIWSSNEVSLTADVADRVVRVARHLTHLGWGMDQVVGDASVMSAVEPPAADEDEWRPSSDISNSGLRTPVRGTLDDLEEHHHAFMNRIAPAGFSAPPPISAYKVFEYRRASDPKARPVAVFSILRPGGMAFRAFDPARKALTVAGMLRHTAEEAAIASGWPAAKVAGFVMGHSERGVSTPVGIERFAYLPLPSIESRGGGKQTVGSIRRVAITSFAEDVSAEVAWARRGISGRDLFDEDTGEAVASLVLLQNADAATQRYFVPASTWTSVTPVVLPGYDDPDHLRQKASRSTTPDQRKRYLERLSGRIDHLIRKALRQFGLSELLAQHADLEWRKVGFLAGVGHADRYGVPDHLRRFLGTTCDSGFMIPWASRSRCRVRCVLAAVDTPESAFSWETMA